jgi:hypothetical protein
MVAKTTEDITVVDAVALSEARGVMGEKSNDYSDGQLQATATYFASIFSAAIESMPPHMPKEYVGLYFAHVFVHSFMGEAITRGIINVKAADDVVNETLDKFRTLGVESARETLFGKGPTSERMN